MKKMMALLLCLVIILPAIPAFAEEDMWQYVLGTDEYGIPYAILTGGKANFDAKSLTVPLTLDGYLVREIGAKAFQTFGEVEEIILHTSVQKIGAYAFAGLPKLQKVAIPENSFLFYIEDGAFMNCRNLREITLPKNLLSIGQQTFSYCTSLKEMTVPKNVQSLNGVVLEYCDALEKVSVQCDCENLGLFIADCYSLKELAFSGDIASVDEYFDHNFFESEERVDPKSPRIFTTPRKMTVIGHRGTLIEETAKRIGVPFVSLKERDEKTYAVQTAYADQLKELGLFLGTDNGYELDRPMTRAEAVTMLYRVFFVYPGGASFNASHPFTDVPDWAYSPVACAYTDGLTYGISETKFGSDMPVTVNQYLTFMLRAMGYEAIDFDWDSPYGLATRLRMLPPDTALKHFTRGDAVAITAATLFAPLKQGDMTLGEKLASIGVYQKEEFDRVFAENPFEGYYAKLAKAEEVVLPEWTPMKSNQQFRNSVLFLGKDLAFIVRTHVTVNKENVLENETVTDGFFEVNEAGEVTDFHYDGVFDFEDYFPESISRSKLRKDLSRWNADLFKELHAAGVLFYQKPTHDAVLADILVDDMRTYTIVHETEEYSLAEVVLGGTPHGSYSSLMLVYKEPSLLGDGTVVSLPLPQETFWGNAHTPDSFEFSEDGKTLVYTKTFADKLEVSIDPSVPSRLVHEKGTYAYTVNLETGDVSLEIIE